MHAGNRSVCSVYLYLHLPHVPIFPFEGLRAFLSLVPCLALPTLPCLTSKRSKLNLPTLPITYYLAPSDPIHLIIHRRSRSRSGFRAARVHTYAILTLIVLPSFLSFFASFLSHHIATRDVRVCGQFNSNGRFESTTVVIVWKRQDARATTTIQVEYPTHVDL